ncbi:hypothetical protein [Treponema lecithinolyticum]|uniref:Uncharacterized protein n=1 Tax=Treponema lecithinolyticum ATCC 700332 TaxID=1321815 RepID=A0ABN0P0G3_TRELE|nr:hypothetical protein [Treponema lecithinolyticum]ERJ94009.1 hypothetical protein HMPREF9193_00523 [Treponema lecithinolyticum ATCC 700332]
MSGRLEQFKRANFFPGLQAGPTYWNSIEDYHFNKELLYNKLFHGFGIVPGFLDSLQVQAQKTKGGLMTLLVSAGMAIDGEGRPLFLYEPQVLILDPKKFKLPSTVYIIIKYEERFEDYFQNKENTDLQGYQKKLETVKLDIVAEIKEPELSIELARIKLANDEAGGINFIKNNDNFCDPGENTLDYRFVPWAFRIKKGVSDYLLTYLIDLFEYTRTVATSAYEVVPVVSLRNLQTVAMTGKMILQCSGIFFDDIIHLVQPLFDLGHQILFEIDEYERTHEDIGKQYTVKSSYETARSAMYALGDLIKSYDNSYEKIDDILKTHRTIMDGIRQTLITKEVHSDDIKYISYAMPHILLFGEERYTLVDTLNFASMESVENHKFELINCSHPTTSNEAFFYPDGTLVHDTVRRWIGGAVRFQLKNIVKDRKTLIIRRTDVHHGDYSVEVTLADTATRTLAVEGSDTKKRWRNLFVIYEEGEIKEYSPEIQFSIGESGRDNSGTVWVYQLL